MRRAALLAALAVAGCFNPDDPGVATGSSSSGSTGSASEPTTGDPTGATDSTDSAPTDPTNDPTDPTDPTVGSTTGSTDSDPTDPTDPTGTTGGSTGTTGASESSSTTDFVPGCDNNVVEDDELCFEDPVELDTLVSTQGVTIADVDADGHLDVIVGDYGDGATGGLYVYLGDGTGAFSNAISTGNTPLIRVAAGPIADNTVDVIAMNATTDVGTRRFRGNGDGSFSSETNYPDSTGWDVALADLNGDGRLDALGTRSAITVRLGNASEGLGAQASYGSANFQCVKARDFNGDAFPDVFGCSNEGITPMSNNGDGVLNVGGSFGTAGSDLVIGDFDGDGNTDVAGTGASVVHTYFGNGNGQFSTGPVLTVNANPIAGKSVDIDDDGFDDIIVVNTSGTTSVLLSNGDGTFQSQQLFSMLEGYLYDMDMGDLNEDGGQDIVVVSPNGDPIQLLLSHV